MASIIDIEGVGEKYAEKLKGIGIVTTDDLLAKGAAPKGRKEIAEQTGIGDGLILQWVNHVDLYRINGVGSEYSDLLEASGVDTVVELAQRRPEHLVEKMEAVNKEKELVRKLPVLSQVEDWVAQAKKLPRVITY
jgi:predicted flap endonuclease-1-like 5' DNA nuclease